MRSIVRGVRPRLVRDATGPPATFLVGWKLFGLGTGIGLAIAFAVGVFVYERRHGRPAVVVRVALAIVTLRAVIGLSGGSASDQLLAAIGVDVLVASLFVGSLLAGRPITSPIAADMYPFTTEMRSSRTFSQVMRVVTAAWGGYFLTRAAVRLTALLTVSTDHYALVVAVTDAPFLVALLAWSVHYTIRALRHHEPEAHSLPEHRGSLTSRSTAPPRG